MKPRDIALNFARGRIAFGAAFLLLPGVVMDRIWIGSDARRRPVKLVTRALGGRDMALGLGVVFALKRGAPARGWLEAAALADGVDAVATVLAGDSISRSARRGALAVAGGSAVLGAVLAQALSDPPAESPPSGPNP